MTKHVPGTRWTPEEIQEISGMRDRGLSWHEIGETFGVSNEAVRLARRKSSLGSPSKGSTKEGEEWAEDSQRGIASLDIISTEFLEIEEALKRSNVDGEKWEVVSFRRSCWTWGSIFKPEKIFFIVGNDLMHSENYQGTTPSGHNILDVDTRLPMLIKAALEINIKAVYRCRSVAPVEVIWIPGNHDPTASLWLCCALEQHFKDDKHVTVDISPCVRKARLWGNLLVGWTHEIVSRHASWVNELAQAFPKEWGKSVYREWHHGHKHKKNEIKTMPVMTHGGVLCRQLTALSPIDAWHFENLFTDAVPGGEAFLWSKDKGVFSNFIAWTGTGIGEKK